VGRGLYNRCISTSSSAGPWLPNRLRTDMTQFHRRRATASVPGAPGDRRRRRHPRPAAASTPRCRSSRPPPPPAPVGAVSGEALSTISWILEPSATSYNVKRAQTTGGPYTTIASVTIGTFTDTGPRQRQRPTSMSSAPSTPAAKAAIPSRSPHPRPGHRHPPGADERRRDRRRSAGRRDLDRVHGRPRLQCEKRRRRRRTLCDRRHRHRHGLHVRIPPQRHRRVLRRDRRQLPGRKPRVRSAGVGDPDCPRGRAGAARSFGRPGDTQILLSWSTVASADTYSLRRGTVSGGPYGTLVSSSLTGTSFTDLGADERHALLLRPDGDHSVGTSPNSNQASRFRSRLLRRPRLRRLCRPAQGNAQVTLSWTASAAATTYTLLRGTGPRRALRHHRLPPAITTTFFTDTVGLANGTPYYYVVRAVNSTGTSGNSNQATGDPDRSSGAACDAHGIPRGRGHDAEGGPDVDGFGGSDTLRLPPRHLGRRPLHRDRDPHCDELQRHGGREQHRLFL